MQVKVPVERAQARRRSEIHGRVEDQCWNIHSRHYGGILGTMMGVACGCTVHLLVVVVM